MQAPVLVDEVLAKPKSPDHFHARKAVSNARYTAVYLSHSLVAETMVGAITVILKFEIFGQIFVCQL